MSKQSVNEFLDQVTAQPELREEIHGAFRGSEDADRTLVELAGARGFHFSMDEFVEALEGRYGDADRLSDDDLDAVAGGIYRGSSKGGGQSLGFPDVCKIPGPPAPFAPTPYAASKIARSATPTKKRGRKGT